MTRVQLKPAGPLGDALPAIIFLFFREDPPPISHVAHFKLTV